MNLTPEQVERRAALSAALRSGKYAQHRGHLQKDGGFCVIGVACDVVDPTAWKEDDVWPVVQGMMLWNRVGWTIPEAVLEYFGFEQKEAQELMALSDGGTIFPKLAELLDNITQERINA